MNQSTPQLPTDPNLQSEQQNAQSDLVDALMKQTQGDMSLLMARYGTHLAMAGASVSPLSPTPTQGSSPVAYGRVA